jgi:hypothetical protein
LGTLLALSIIAAGRVAGDSSNLDQVELAKPASASATRAIAIRETSRPEAFDDIQMDKLRHHATRQDVKDVFTSQTWYVPPPPPIAAVAPAPSAPPLAFVYSGQLVEGEKRTVFLSRQDHHYTVREGDVIDDTYRVNAIRGSLMELTYIPLDMKQTMQIGEQN